MTNHLADLADEIRRIPDTLATLSGDPAHRRGYLEDLAERVERLAAEPVDVDASTELTASFGLEPEQEIRARAALAAATALGPAIAAAVAGETGPLTPQDVGRGRDALVDLTEVFTALIRTGERPA